MRNRQSVWFVVAAAACLLVEPIASLAADSKAEEELKKKVAERQTKGSPAKPNTAGIRLATPAELERLYLDGRITAKEYQRKLADYKAAMASMTNQTPQAQAIEALRRDAGKNTPLKPAQAKAKTAPPPPLAKGATNQPASAEKKFTEVEAKFDELIQKKSQREQAAKAAATNASPAAPKTKREKLDALLKAFIDGRLSEKDYDEQRAKVINEPE
jgi:hypothetical protein